MEHWYVVNTKARQEQVAQAHLERQSFRTHVPLVRAERRRRGRWQAELEPLFPGYLFIRFDVNTQSSAPIRSTRGVIGVVRFGGRPAPVPEGLVETLIDSAHLTTTAGTRTDLFQPGTDVTVADGPFAGLLGTVEKASSAERVHLLLEILGGLSRVTVSRHQLVPAA